MSVRLKDMLRIKDGSINKLLIKGDTQAHNRIFDESNISTMSAQFRQDFVDCFDVVKNNHGEKVLVVKLTHWK